jgi:hypothetical protein
MLNLKVIFLICAAVIAVSFPVFAELQLIEEYPPVTKEEPASGGQEGALLTAKQDECFANFNISSVDFKDSKVTPLLSLLTEYSQCRSAVKDSMNECNNLKAESDIFKTCCANFKEYQALFGRIVRDGRVTPGMFDLWLGRGTEKDFQSFMQGFLKEDISVCESVPADERYECRAVITGDDSLCKSESCESKAAYVKAIRSGNIDECNNIKNGSIKAMCRGYISKDEKICDKEAKFEFFKRQYCK